MMDNGSPLSLTQTDSWATQGIWIQDEIGAEYRHNSNGKTYRITGIIWLADTDEWGVIHQEILTTPGNKLHSVPIVRSWKNFNGKNKQDEPRYVRVGFTPSPLVHR